MKYTSALEARQKGSLCNFQLEFSIQLPSFGIPMIGLPELPSLPTVNLFCPLDGRAEKKYE